MPDPIISDQTQTAPPPTFPEVPDIPAMPPDTNMNIPPMIASSQTPKKKSGRIIATILGILLLVGAVGAGVVLVGQKQLFQQKASLAEPCKACVGAQCKTIASPPNCSASFNECSSNADCYTPPPSNDCSDAGGSCKDHCTAGSETASRKDECGVVNYCCVPNEPEPTDCSDAGGTCKAHCIAGSETASRKDECGVVNYCCVPTTPPLSCDFTTQSCLDTRKDWMPNHIICGTCTGDNVCGTWEGEAGVKKSVCCGSASCVAPYPWTFGDYCLSSDTSNREACYHSQTDCARVVPCTGPTTPPTLPPGQTPTPTPTATPIVAACSAVKAYDANWNPLTGVQLSALSVGDVVRFAVSGTPVDQIDNAQFTVNGELRTDVILKEPGTFYIDYTIPPVVTSFTVTAQLNI